MALPPLSPAAYKGGLAELRETLEELLPGMDEELNSMAQAAQRWSLSESGVGQVLAAGDVIQAVGKLLFRQRLALQTTAALLELLEKAPGI